MGHITFKDSNLKVVVMPAWSIISSTEEQSPYIEEPAVLASPFSISSKREAVGGPGPRHRDTELLFVLTWSTALLSPRLCRVPGKGTHVLEM